MATAYNDSEAYGDLYQWGRGTDGHEKRSSSTTSTISTTDNPGNDQFITSASTPYDWISPQNNNLWQGVNGINNPCPPGFRLPTDTEWVTELHSWINGNREGAYESPLKLTAAGYKSHDNGEVTFEAVFGRYWSSTYFISTLPISFEDGIVFQFHSSGAHFESRFRVEGSSVRCLKD